MLEIKRKIKNKLVKKHILNIFLLIAPLVDVITSLMIDKTTINLTLGMFLRTIFLVFLFCCCVFYKSINKKYILYYLTIITTFFLIYLLNTYVLKGLSSVFIEIKMLIKIFYFPIFSILIFFLFENNKIKKPNSNTFTYIFITYIILIILPSIFNVSFLTYSNGKAGYIGWFHSPNEIGAILAILFPFVFSNIFFINPKKYSYIIFAIIIYVMFQIGTKVPFLSIFLTIFALLFAFVLKILIEKSYKENLKKYFIRPVLLPFTVSLIISMAIFGYSNSSVNINLHKQNLLNQSQKQNDNTLNKDDYLNLVFSSRDKYTRDINIKYELANFKEKLFGLGYLEDENLTNKKYNIVEIDYFDIFYIYGIVGFIIYFIFIIIMIFDITYYIFKNYKKILDDYEILSYIISLFLAFGIAFFAGHVFTAPSVSVLPAVILPVLYLKINDGKGILNKLIGTISNKIKIILPLSVLLIVLIYILSFTVNKKEFNVNLLISNNQFEESEYLKLVKVTDFEDSYDLNIKDKTYEYEYQEKNLLFTIQLVERTFYNNDIILFWEIDNPLNKKINFNLFYNINDNLKKEYSFNKNIIEKEFSAIGGYDKVTLPSYYLEFESDKSILISRGFKYTEKFTDYSGGERSILKELIAESNDITINNNQSSQKFILNSKEKIEGYYILSDKNLFKDENTLNEYIEILNNSKYTSWLSYDGSYHKLPYSIEPYTTEAYGRNPGSTISREIFHRFEESRIYKNLFLNSLHILFHYMPRDKSKVWNTEFTSTWLKKDYQIRAPYIDTRHNENISRNLFNIGDKLENIKIMNSALFYADFLLEKYDQKDILLFDTNFLFPDYFSTNHTIKTHSSLNHQLAIVNYLLETYLITDIEDYKILALNLLRSIDNMHNLWIRDNKDLWYQVDQYSNFSLNDYTFLTLEDLINVQENLLLIGYSKNKNIDKLLKSKYLYLQDNNINISNNLKKRFDKVIFK